MIYDAIDSKDIQLLLNIFYDKNQNDEKFKVPSSLYYLNLNDFIWIDENLVILFFNGYLKDYWYVGKFLRIVSIGVIWAVILLFNYYKSILLFVHFKFFIIDKNRIYEFYWETVILE